MRDASSPYWKGLVTGEYGAADHSRIAPPALKHNYLRHRKQAAMQAHARWR